MLTVSLTSVTQAQTTPTQAAAGDLVQNGDFSDLAVPGLSSLFGEVSRECRCNPNGEVQEVTHWINDGINHQDFNFVFLPGQADTVGAHLPAAAGGGLFKLWGPGTNGGIQNGLQPECTPLPACGGNFLALDASTGSPHPIVAAVSQQIHGLTPGDKYDVSFFWATAQQFDKVGNTTEELSVGLCRGENFTPENGCHGPGEHGTQIETTETRFTPEHGALPWVKKTFTFEAVSPTEFLSFLASGTPDDQPPFVLLDSVSMRAESNVIPEPGTWLLLGLGFAVIAGLAHRRPRWLHVPA